MRTRIHYLVILLVAGLIVAACDDLTTDEQADIDATPEPTVVDDDARATTDGDETSSDVDRGLVEPIPAGEISDDWMTAGPGSDLEGWLEQATAYSGITRAPDGTFYVSYERHGAVLVLSPDGEIVDAFGEWISEPRSINVLSDGSFVLADSRRLHLFGADGDLQARLRFDPFLRGELITPYSIAVAPDDHLFVTLSQPDMIRVFDESGRFVDEVEEMQYGEVGPPSRLAFDSQGRLYLFNSPLDLDAPVIEVRAPDGIIDDHWVLDRDEANEDVDEVVPANFAIGPSGDIYLLATHSSNREAGQDPQEIEVWLEIYDSEHKLMSRANLELADGEIDAVILPRQIVVAGDGSVLIPDWRPDGNQILRFSPDGERLEPWAPDVEAFLCERDDREHFIALQCEQSRAISTISQSHVPTYGRRTASKNASVRCIIRSKSPPWNECPAPG